MLVPDLLPPRMWSRTSVVHGFPEHWVDAEIDTHRFDDCPCSPIMVQEFSGCQGHHHGGYRWRVEHTRIVKTEGTR